MNYCTACKTKKGNSLLKMWHTKKICYLKVFNYWVNKKNRTSENLIIPTKIYCTAELW